MCIVFLISRQIIAGDEQTAYTEVIVRMTFKLFIWLSNIMALSAHDQGYSRNALFALKLISTFVFLDFHHSHDMMVA